MKPPTNDDAPPPLPPPPPPPHPPLPPDPPPPFPPAAAAASTMRTEIGAQMETPRKGWRAMVFSSAFAKIDGDKRIENKKKSAAAATGSSTSLASCASLGTCGGMPPLCVCARQKASLRA
jgi:hypothetical protein